MKNYFNNNTNIDSDKPVWFIRNKHLIYYILSFIETLLIFRFLFKLLGANPDNGFVSFLYSFAGIFIRPFVGIFNSYVSNGIETKSILEPATIIAAIVYAVIAWGIVGLIRIKAEKDTY